jgi:hypothetical protein
MKIGDLYTGDVEGKNEFTSDNIEQIENTFLKLDHLEDNFINKNQYFIYGHKGTGKTSLLKYIEYKVREKNDIAITILFKDIKQEPLTYTIFRTLLSQAEDKDTAAITFWKWFILSIIVNDIFPNYLNKDHLIFNAKNSMFQILSKFLLKLIGGINVTTSLDDIDIEIKMPTTSMLNETNEIFSAGLKIKKLENYVKEHLHKKVFILIDELETSTLTSSFKEDSILIKNLILTVDNLNRISTNLALIVAVRTEILHNVFTSGAELNKLLESKGEETKWTFDNFGEGHPLMKMMIKKFRYSMNKFSPEEKEKIDNATNNEIFERWFPNKLMDDENGNNAKFLLHNTWNKPRDLVRFLQIMQKKAKNKHYFERTEYDQSVKEYSSKAWIELKEELISILTDKEIQDIENVFANFSKMFTYDELVNRFKDKTDLLMQKIKEIIRVLYKIGFLGNNYKNGTTHIYRYSYRGDNILDENERIEVHRGLWKNFSLKEESNYKKSILNNQRKDTPFSSLADRMRGFDK